jgi:hypothetical protein
VARRLTHGLTDGLTDGLMDGRTDGRTDGLTDGLTTSFETFLAGDTLPACLRLPSNLHAKPSLRTGKVAVQIIYIWEPHCSHTVAYIQYVSLHWISFGPSFFFVGLVTVVDYQVVSSESPIDRLK